MGFCFLDPFPLIDGELELVAPDRKWADALLRAHAHPATSADPSIGSINLARIEEFLTIAPRGHQPADPANGRVPVYHFWLRLRPIGFAQSGAHGLPRWGEDAPPVEIAGGLGLRIGHTPDLELYVGHIGYNVHPPARGHHYAERSCRLVFPLARAHGLRRLWITCNPDNWPSRRTCERLGGHLAGIVALPREHPLYQKGEREKCRFWIDI